MPKFNETIRPTSFGYYDSDPVFQKDADNMVTFILRRLGEDVLSVELTKKQIWDNFEAATRMFNAKLVEYQAISNLGSLLGAATGSVDPNTGLSTLNYSNVYVQGTLEFLEGMAAPYSALIGYGQLTDSISGSIVLENGRQDYDIYSELKLDSGQTIYGLQPSGSVNRLRVYEVFHYQPVQYLYNSNLANNFGTAALSGYGDAYSSDTRFHVLPLYEDVLRAGMLDTAQRIRRSHYSYKISGRNIRIYPIPQNMTEGVNNRLWMRVGYRQPIVPGDYVISGSTVISGSSGGVYGGVGGFINDVAFGANSPANIPFGPLSYKSLNIWSRNWIAEMTLAICLQQLGWIRNKFDNIPIPGAELKLNGDSLLSTSKDEMDRLLTGLKELLESLTYDKIAEREATKAENMVKQLSYVPIPPKYVIRLW